MSIPREYGKCAGNAVTEIWNAVTGSVFTFCSHGDMVGSWLDFPGSLPPAARIM